MKAKQIVISILAGCICTGAQAQVSEDFGEPTGYMSVYNNTGSSWLWGSSWGIADLIAETSDNVTFVLKPNTDQYVGGASSSDPADVVYWTNSEDGGLTPGPAGNKVMEANCYMEANPIGTGSTNALFVFTVDAMNLSTNYSCVGFIKILNPNDNWATYAHEWVAITNTGTYTVQKSIAYSDSAYVLQAGWAMKGMNANPDTDWGSVTVSIDTLTFQDNDQAAPNPDPMTWETEPAGIGSSSIAMIASTATDSNGVEYLFHNVTLNYDSGWLSSNSWTDSGLDPLTSYDYKVKARDMSSQQNETDWSATKTATTLTSDPNAPTPDPMSFADSEASPVTIKLTANAATDDQTAVEYYFTCTGGSGHDSDWQSSPVYVDSGLTPDSNYSYTVTARDLNGNETAASGALAISTLSLPGSYSITNSLQGFTGNNQQGMTVHELALAGFEIASDDAGKPVTFDASGATFGDGATWENRNVLRTIGQDYGDGDFEMYATLVTSNTTEQAGFIGVGQGLIGAWGVPDMELAGVNATAAEIQGNWCKVFTWINGVQEQLTETTGISTVTNRVRMAHDAAAHTITIELDEYYDGTFVADRVLDTHSTTNLWADMPQRIYVAGGAGIKWKDLQITADAVSTPTIGVDDLTISTSSDGSIVLNWTGVAGQTYDVQYKTDLSGGEWTVDPSDGCADIPGTDGPMSATSTLDAPEAFYNIVTE